VIPLYGTSVSSFMPNLTMPPGAIVLREGVLIASAMEELLLIWGAGDAEGWVNRLIWIPL
jgi:hypothetical protein